jgi:hypothetical protein
VIKEIERIFLCCILFQLISMACLRLKLVFPKDSPNQLSHRLHGTRVRITRSNLKDVLWSVNEFRKILTEEAVNETSTSDGKMNIFQDNYIVKLLLLNC